MVMRSMAAPTSVPHRAVPHTAASHAAALHAAFRERRVFESLDGLRCAAVLAVIWHHTAGRDAALGLAATQRGFLGVDLFFVLSGFLIVSLLLRERERNGHVDLAAFYARRSLRIFPLYYALLLAVAAVRWLAAPGSPTSARFFEELPFYLTYTSNWIERASLLAPAWSLAAEEQFYLLWPPVEKWLPRLVLPLLLGFLALNQALNFGLLGETVAAHHARLEMLQSTFTPIGLGVLLAHGLHRPRGFEALQRVLAWRGASVASAALLLALASVPGDISGAPRLGAQLAMAALVASCVVREDHALAPLLRWGPVARAGVVSYGLYLLHLFAREAVVRAGVESPGLLFVATLALSLALAELSHRVLESPFLRLKRRFQRLDD